MEDKDFIQLWKAQDAKLEQSLALNLRVLRELQNLKAKSAMASLSRVMVAGIVAGILWLALLGFALAIAIWQFSPNGIYFVVSMGAIFLINLKGVADYIRQLTWAQAIDYEGSIAAIQGQLSRLRLSVIRNIRFMVLQFPFWTTFYLSPAWFPQTVPAGYLILQIAVTAAFVWLAWFLYQKLDIRNADKAWYVKLLAGTGGKSVLEAIGYYRELEAFKK